MYCTLGEIKLQVLLNEEVACTHLSCSPELQMAALKFASVSACSIDNLCPWNECRTLAAASKSWQEVAFSSGGEGKLHSLLLL